MKDLSSHRIAPYFALAAVLALALLSGCGSSDSSSSTGAKEAGSTTGKTEEGEAEEAQGGESGEEGEGAEGEGGGGSSEASSGAGVASKAKFISAADQICSKARKATNAQLGRYIGQSDPKALEELVDNVIVPELEGEIAGIQAIGASGAASESESAMVSILEGLIEEAEADPQSFVLESQPVIESTKEGKQLGFKSCGAV